MRSARNLAWLAGAVLLAGFAATTRWPDSAHAMGVVRPGGGAARHAAALGAGPERYQIVLTAPVVGRWRGDARLSLEGSDGPLPFEASLSGPVLDLHVHHWPRLEGDVLRDLAPGDRLALWVSFAAATRDPVCGMPCAAGAPEADGRCFCGDECRAAYLATPERWQGTPRGRPTRLVLRDEPGGAPLLTIPIALGGKGGGRGHH